MITPLGIRLVLSMFLQIIGLYLLICGIRVRGSIYSNSHLQNTNYYSKYVKLVRLFCFLLCGLFTANFVMNWEAFTCAKVYDDAVLAGSQNAEQLYLDFMVAANRSIFMLCLSIGTVIVMILVAVYVTNRYSTIGEKLSQAAFKKNKK